MTEPYSRSRQKFQPTTRDQWQVQVRNLPDHLVKEQVAYFLWKQLESCHGLIRNGNPIIQLTVLPTEKALQLHFRSEEQAANCLQLNQIYFGKKVLLITSRFLSPSRSKLLNTDKLKIVKSIVLDEFKQIYVGNLPHMTASELMNYLSQFGELSSFINDTKDSSSSACYCEYITTEQTEEALRKLDNSKLKGRSVIAKRSALMKSKDKTKITSTKASKFESVEDMYLTFDAEGFFRNKKISCVLLLKNIIPVGANKQAIVKDILSQVEKIGALVRSAHKNQNVYLQYERIQYSQIAYLLISRRKYDGKQIEVLFYDPIKFADDILI